MKLAIRYQELDWWFWAVITAGLGAGLLGLPWGLKVALAASLLNLLFYIVRDASIVSFPVQVREVWLAFVLIAYFVPGMAWLFYLLTLGMIMVVFFDRCGIAMALRQMPWNHAQTEIRSH